MSKKQQSGGPGWWTSDEKRATEKMNSNVSVPPRDPTVRFLGWGKHQPLPEDPAPNIYILLIYSTNIHRVSF